MPITQVTVIFEGPAMDDGVSVADLNETLKRLQTAVRLMASHLAGVEPRGRPREWLRRQSSLRLMAVFPGSFRASLALPDVRYGEENYGAQALDAILELDENAGRRLPPRVARSINDIGRSLSSDVWQVMLADPDGRRRVTINRTRHTSRRPRYKSPNPPITAAVEAMLYGRLLEVNWQNGTAQLHRYGEPVVPLQFESGLNETMRQLATRYVAVRGEGRITTQEEWATVAIREIVAEASEIDAFYARPPRAFDPQQAAGFYRDDADDPVDIAEFVRGIYEGRDL